LVNILNIDKNYLIAVFNELKIDESVRIEELTVEKYIYLLNKITRKD